MKTVAEVAGPTIALVGLVATNLWNARTARTTIQQLANSHEQLVDSYAQAIAAQKANSLANMWKFCDSLRGTAPR